MIEGIITISSLSKLTALKAKYKAEVPLLHDSAYFERVYKQIFFLNETYVNQGRTILDFIILTLEFLFREVGDECTIILSLW